MPGPHPQASRPPPQLKPESFQEPAGASSLPAHCPAAPRPRRSISPTGEHLGQGLARSLPPPLSRRCCCACRRRPCAACWPAAALPPPLHCSRPCAAHAPAPVCAASPAPPDPPIDATQECPSNCFDCYPQGQCKPNGCAPGTVFAGGACATCTDPLCSICGPTPNTCKARWGVWRQGAVGSRPRCASGAVQWYPRACAVARSRRAPAELHRVVELGGREPDCARVSGCAGSLPHCERVQGAGSEGFVCAPPHRCATSPPHTLPVTTLANSAPHSSPIQAAGRAVRKASALSAWMAGHCSLAEPALAARAAMPAPPVLPKPSPAPPASTCMASTRPEAAWAVQTLAA